MKTQEQILKESLLSQEGQPDQKSTTSTKLSEAQEESLKENLIKTQPPIQGNNCLQRPFFTWVEPLIKFGNTTTIVKEVMPQLPQHMLESVEFKKLDENFKTTKPSKRQGATLSKVMFKTYKKIIISLTILLFVIVSLIMYGPILTSQIISYVSLPQEDKSVSIGAILFIGTLIIQVFTHLGRSHMYYLFGVLGYNLSNTLSLMIYHKSLRYPALSQKQFQVSDIINYSQVDAERMTYMGYQIASILFFPFQIIVGLYLMYSYIGIAFLTGIGVMICTSVSTFFLAKKSIAYNDKVLKVKDERMKLTQQMLDSIKFIKVNAIEKYFFKKLNLKRNQQLQIYRKKGLLDVLNIFVYWLSGPLILSLTFATYTYLGNTMEAGVAFTTIMIFAILQFPLRMMPSAISQLIQMYSSIKRMQKYLLAPEIQNTCYTKCNEQGVAVKIENGTFYWGMQKEKKEEDEGEEKQQKQKEEKQMEKQKEKQKKKAKKDEEESEKEISFLEVQENMAGQKKLKQQKYIKALSNINLKINSNKFTIVIGDIGSGKSTLLLAILNQTKCSQQTKVSVNGSLAYSAQKPWIMSATVKKNILFTLPFDQTRYKDALYYASFEKDIELLANGDQTQIGQKGINLSGGQKARISLARALYSNKDILLLDDIISAVDVHVGEFLMRQTILKYLKNKTVIMPTHAVKFAQFADDIIILKKGRVVRQGHYKDISKSPQFQEVYKKQSQKEKEAKREEEEQNSKLQEEMRMMKEAMHSKSKSKQKSKDQENEVQNKESGQVIDKIVDELMLPQDHQKGEINYAIFKEYLKLNGGPFFAVMVICAMILWITFTTASNIWMQKWCQDPRDGNGDLYVYLTFSISSNLFIFIRAYSLILSGVQQGQTVHKKMIKSLLYTSLTKFYNRVPVGRIISRLTKDLRQLDQAIGFAIGSLLVCFFSTLGCLVICFYASTLYILIPFVIILFSCYKLKNYYMAAQRQVSRLQKSTNSPIVSGFISTINGLSTIRAYKLQNQFFKDQTNFVDINKRVRITRQGMQCWFAQRLAFFSFFVNMAAIGFAILSKNDNASLAGLLMTYVLNLAQQIIQLTFSWTYFQNKLVSLQRIYNFMKIQPQGGYQQYCKQWRTRQEGYTQVMKKGQIQFKKVNVRYRQNLPLVLKDVSFRIKAGEKVGIVGRTGAGKSTLMATILRLTEPQSGQILLDSTQISTLPLKSLRHAITMIDQQPTLINSTFRENLDITHQYSDQQLLQILRDCGLYDIIMEKEGLDGKVTNDSLSAGEKQLLCICRAFLKKSLIVLIDEATANIDLKNDELIQKVIQTKFVNSTVLTIAHRLSTLKHSDKIIVMGEGKVLQFGSPAELLEKENGIYAEMIKKNQMEFLV